MLFNIALVLGVVIVGSFVLLAIVIGIMAGGAKTDSEPDQLRVPPTPSPPREFDDDGSGWGQAGPDYD